MRVMMIAALLCVVTMVAVPASADIKSVGDLIAALDGYDQSSPIAIAVGRGFKAAPIAVDSTVFITSVGQLRSTLTQYQASKPVGMYVGNLSYDACITIEERLMSRDFRAGWWDKHIDSLSESVVVISEGTLPIDRSHAVMLRESTRTE